MPQIGFHEGAEKIHAPLATLAANLLGQQPGGGIVTICDVSAPAPARRSDDMLVVLERGPHERIERIGANRVHLTYTDPTAAAPLAALVAGAASARSPVFADPASAATLMLAERIAKSDIPVLIEGPTGTGKEVMSRFIHQSSPRRDGPFIAINCAAMPETMLEAMLFGHRKGAFTGATEAAEGFFRAADGGTLLLDEIAEMPLGLQAKLLRALQEGEVVPIGATKPVAVNVRVIACANRDLPQEVAEGRFRADLYYRLNVFPLTLHALRERVQDVAPLAFAMVLRHTEGTGGAPKWISPAAIAKLKHHAWPGNVRELENVVRRALLIAGDAAIIGAEHIMFDSAARAIPMPPAPTPDAPHGEPSEHAASTDASRSPVAAGNGRLSSIVRKLEAEAIVETLEQFGGNRIRTAAKLGISERTLRYRLAGMREAGLAVAGAGR